MRVIFGHKDFRDPNDTDTWTACPGTQVMARLALITFAKEAPAMVSQADFDAFVKQQKAINEFQNEILVGQKAAIDFLAELAVDMYGVAVDHEVRIKALETRPQ